MTSGFMCYVNENGIQKGIICSMYMHNVWSEDLTSHNIELHYEIASDLAMRYLVFAISSNNYEWEVLHVQDSTNNAIAHVTIPDKYDGAVKFGIKLYDTAPTVGAILNVGFDYVVTGGINMPVVGPNDKIQMTCATPQATIYYTLDGSTPSASKTKYSAPFSVDKSCTIKAIGVKSGLNNSAVSTLEVEYQGGGEIIPPNPPVIEEFEDMIKKSYSLTGRGTTDSLGFTFNEGDELANDVKSNNFILAKIKFSNFGGLGDTFVHDTPASVDIMNNRPEHAILVLKSNVQFYFSLADFTLWINNATSDETLASLTLIDVYGVGEDAINSMKQALASANITIDVYLES